MKKTKIITIFIITAIAVSIFGAALMSASAAAEAPSIDYATVVFKDAVDLRYFVKSDDAGETELLIWTDIPENKQFTKDTADDVITEYYNDSVSVPGETYKAFTYDKVAARQMGDTYYVRALYTDGATELYSKVVKYSIQQYAKNMLAEYSGGDADTLLPLLESMLEYGANAQICFDHNADRLVNAQTVSVKVEGGAISEDDSTHGIYYSGDTLNLTAPETNAEGKKFSHWKDQNGNRVTMPYTVTGQEGDLLTLTAVYSNVDVQISATDESVEEDTEFDVKTMFKITADGKPVEVTDDMIDKAAYTGATAPYGKYTIVLTYISSDGISHTASAELTVERVWIGPF